MLVYINGNRLVKEESVSKNSRKVSGIETTYGSKMLWKVKKKIANITIYITSIAFPEAVFLSI